jgi:hypothetical protein
MSGRRTLISFATPTTPAIRAAARSASYLSVVVDEAGERDNAIFDGHGDICRIELGLPPKLMLDVSFDVALAGTLIFDRWSNSEYLTGSAMTAVK